MKQVNLFGYKIYDNGTILKLNGKPMAFHKTIHIKVNNEVKNVSYARVIYYAFNQDTFDFDNHSYCIKHKDNNPKNNRLDNLYMTNQKDYLWGEKNKKAKLTEEEVEEIRKLYFIGEQENKGNGLNYPIKKYSYRKLAEKFGVSHSLIQQIINGGCRNNG